jgi:glutamate decarboxylase
VDDLQKRTGLDIPIHVDGASGAFIAPFAYPKYKWAFDVPRVHSINTSGHKFGLVYAGLGWILWKDESMLHKDLIFELRELSSLSQCRCLFICLPVDYLGSVEYSFTLYVSFLPYLRGHCLLDVSAAISRSPPLLSSCRYVVSRQFLCLR